MERRKVGILMRDTLFRHNESITAPNTEPYKRHNSTDTHTPQTLERTIINRTERNTEEQRTEKVNVKEKQ